jgi:ribonuclease HII
VVTTTLDLLDVERPLLARGEVVVGIDEVGRGALAGPLTVGAVVLTCCDTPPETLTDSKLLTAARREALVEPLEQWAADWSLGSVSSSEIDAWGLRLALAVAATRALHGLRVRPTYALIDGAFNLLRAPTDIAFGVALPPELSYEALRATTIVKGDQKCASIAAASVLAKVHRDAVMTDLDSQFQAFGWARNKGYGAASHLEALREWGPNVHHRQSWHLPERRALEYP